MQRQGEHKKLFGLTVIATVVVSLIVVLLFQFRQISEIKDQIRYMSQGMRGAGNTDGLELCSGQTSYGQNQLLDKKSQSVCLIQGEYVFTDSSGLSVSWNDVKGIITASNTIADYSNDKRRVDIQYTGSGFLVDGRGYVVTNKHIAVPWLETPRDQQMISAGYLPKVVMFRAFFPGKEKPYDLELLASARNDDISLLRIKDYDGSIPVLECDYDGLVAVGMPVTVLGYPTGFDLITARIDSAADKLNYSSFDELGLSLSGQRLIRPMATSGICGQVVPGKIAYDAPTAIGASGSPVFNSSGKVIAINTALLRGFAGTNFGVPVSRLRAFLENIE